MLNKLNKNERLIDYKKEKMKTWNLMKIFLNIENQTDLSATRDVLLIKFKFF